MARFWLRLYLNRVGVKNTVPRHGSIPFYSQMYYNLDDTIETRQRERSVVFVVCGYLYYSAWKFGGRRQGAKLDAKSLRLAAPFNRTNHHPGLRTPSQGARSLYVHSFQPTRRQVKLPDILLPS